MIKLLDAVKNVSKAHLESAYQSPEQSFSFILFFSCINILLSNTLTLVVILYLKTHFLLSTTVSQYCQQIA